MEAVHDHAEALRAQRGFSFKDDAVKTIDNRYTQSQKYDFVFQTLMETGNVVISVSAFSEFYDGLTKDMKKLGASSVSVSTLGSSLNSDFDEDDPYNREDARYETVKLLKDFKKDYKSVMSDAGNAYALAYVDHLLNVALDSSRFLNTSEAVPFLGMVLHGSIEFSGAPINMEGDDKYMFLKALENGAGLYFTVAMQNTELLKGTLEYNQYYSVQFSVWRDEIAKTYKKYNDVMASKQDSYIVGHEFLNAENGYDVIRTQDLIDNPNGEPEKLNNSRVVSVVYENGEGFLLNYNSFEVKVTFNGVEYTIPGLSFATYELN